MEAREGEEYNRIPVRMTARAWRPPLRFCCAGRWVRVPALTFGRRELAQVPLDACSPVSAQYMLALLRRLLEESGFNSVHGRKMMSGSVAGWGFRRVTLEPRRMVGAEQEKGGW